MVRFYNRKTYHGTTSKDIIKMAVEEINGHQFIKRLKTIKYLTQLFNSIFTDTGTILV
jgi:hypothetical protein